MKKGYRYLEPEDIVVGNHYYSKHANKMIRMQIHSRLTKAKILSVDPALKPSKYHIRDETEEQFKDRLSALKSMAAGKSMMARNLYVRV